MENTFIYALCDPINSNVRYIGKSNNPKKRYRTHISEHGNYYKLSWIKSLKRKGLKPKLIIIDEVNIKDWKFWEMHYISLYLSWGFKLTNLTNGGDGSGLKNKKGYWYGKYRSKETKEKIRKTKLGHKQSEETKRKRSDVCVAKYFASHGPSHII